MPYMFIRILLTRYIFKKMCICVCVCRHVCVLINSTVALLVCARIKRNYELKAYGLRRNLKELWYQQNSQPDREHLKYVHSLSYSLIHIFKYYLHNFWLHESHECRCGEYSEVNKMFQRVLIGISLKSAQSAVEIWRKEKETFLWNQTNADTTSAAQRAGIKCWISGVTG